MSSNGTIEQTTTTAAGNSVRKSGSIFGRARMSFMRSSGSRGADVNTLRGTNGADFDGIGKIKRGGGSAGDCGSTGGGFSSFIKMPNTHKDRVIMIKGPYCFVFENETSSSPSYAVALNGLKAKRLQSSKLTTSSGKNKTTVLLTKYLGDVQYELEFSDITAAGRFVDVVNEQSKIANIEETRKSLGHDHMIMKRSSVRFAESIGVKKMKDQPDMPLSIQERMTSIPIIF